MKNFRDLRLKESAYNGVGYGRFELADVSLDLGGIKLTLFKDGGIVRYVREGQDKVEKVVVPSNKCYMVVNPVEPINLPKPVSDFILAEFSKSISIAPGSSVTAYTTFPVEIGVFLTDVKDSNVIDFFSLVKQKYTLYGSPRNGVICRYWAGEVSTDIPEADPLREGVLKLKITNLSSSWATLTNIVLRVDGMSIYYDSERVSSAAQIDILSPSLAETSMVEEPLKEGMNRSITLRSQRKTPISRSKFTMEWGL